MKVIGKMAKKAVLAFIFGTIRMCILGEWKNDKMDGYGSYNYASGNGYDGSFSNGYIHGKGGLLQRTIQRTAVQ